MVMIYIHIVVLESNRCFMPSFIEIGSLVLEKVLKVYTVYGRGGHLGHVTCIILISPSYRCFICEW